MDRIGGRSQGRYTPYSCSSSIQRDYEREMCEPLRSDRSDGQQDSTTTTFSRELPDLPLPQKNHKVRNEGSKIHYKLGRARATGQLRQQGLMEVDKQLSALGSRRQSDGSDSGEPPKGMGDEQHDLPSLRGHLPAFEQGESSGVAPLQVQLDTEMGSGQDSYSLGREWSWEDKPCEIIATKCVVLYSPGYTQELQRRVAPRDYFRRDELQTLAQGDTDKSDGQYGQQADTLSPLQCSDSEGDMEDCDYEPSPVPDYCDGGASDSEEDTDYLLDNGKGKEKEVHKDEYLFLDSDDDLLLEDYDGYVPNDDEDEVGIALSTNVRTWVDNFKAYVTKNRLATLYGRDGSL